MAFANDIRTNRAGLAQPSIGDRIAAFFKLATEARAKRAVYRQTVRELNALTERELADLGIHRSLIAKIAHEAAYGN